MKITGLCKPCIAQFSTIFLIVTCGIKDNQPVNFADIKKPDLGKVFEANREGVVSIPLQEITGYDSLQVIALGFEPVMFAPFNHAVHDTIILKEKPFDMEEFVFEAGDCGEMSVGSQAGRKRINHSFGSTTTIYGIEISGGSGFQNKNFTAVDYFVANRESSKKGTPFRFIIFKMESDKPGEVYYKTPFIDDYELNWYNFRIRGSWNTFEFKDTIISMPEEGFLIAIECKTDYKLDFDQVKATGKFPDDLPCPSIGRSPEHNARITWTKKREPGSEWRKVPPIRKLENGEETEAYYNLMIRVRYSSCR